ncbi:uncharacterized protein LOC108163837 isoform X2 [Drosophila miranda]|uniref:uncharacterized protein LOC108163837 isoform X2 n=1 Tax=Drosophila miranda TaxID=7229 RepID=UPI0007E884FD|nr:uncharacterized protein LOC108163837 isoform X2 [Drosophila miranda]
MHRLPLFMMTTISIMWFVDHGKAQNEGSQWDLEGDTIEPTSNQSAHSFMQIQKIPKRYRNFLNWSNEVQNNIKTFPETRNPFYNEEQRIKRLWDPAYNESLDYRENQKAFFKRRKRQGKRRNITYPLEPHMEFNRLPTYGKRYHIIVMMPSLGDEKFIMTLTADTNDYLIDEIVTVPNGKPNPWRYTKKLPSILRMYGIRVTKLPYRSGYYYHTHASYFNSYQRYVYIIIKAFKNRGKILAHKARRGIKILFPKSMSCNPMLTLPFCKNPDEPIDVSPRSHLQFFAELGDECDNLEYDHVDWNFYDLRETYLVGHAGISKGLVLKIPPYKVKFKYNPRLVRFLFLLRVNSIINGINCVARCYVRMVAPQVEPRIRGNMNRKANFAREIVMDASRSRDRSRARTEDYSRIFLWGCVSVDDPKNKYCRPKMSTKEKISLPPYSLKLGSFYNYSLSMVSRMDFRVHVTVYQMLQAVKHRTITAHILCHRNCLMKTYAPIDSFHLSGECVDCDSKIYRYRWYVTVQGGQPKIESKFKNLVTQHTEAELLIRLEIRLKDGLTGAANLIMKRNDGPQNGECTIFPVKGMEAHTYFYVPCKGFETKYPPLQFRYTVALNVIDSNVPYPLYKLTLPSTNELNVSICDYLDMCIDVQLKVTVLKTKKIGDYNENNTLKHLSDVKNYIREVPYLLSRGRWNKAYVKTLVAIQKIETSAEGIEVYEYLDRGTITTGAQLEQLSVLACQVVERLMPMDYKEAAMVAQIFTRMSVVFEQIIQDIEWLHRAAYNALTEHHVFFVSTLALPTEKHPPAQCKTQDEICKMGQNLGAERKFEMDVDPATLIRINWWLLETWYLYKCVYYLGVLGTKRHHPYDRALSMFQGGISYQMNVTEVTEPIENITVNTVDDMFHVHISAGLLGELRDLLADPAVLFQIISQQNFHNMYWWYPEPLPSETNVLIVHAYSPKKNYPMAARLPLKNPLNYHLNISKFSANPEFVKWMTNSTIESHSHIHVYKIPLRSKSVLAVRIGHVTEEILIFMSLNQKPKMHEIREKACHITPNMKGKRIWMTNNCPGTSIAYVGVLSREHKFEDDQNDNRPRKPSKVKNLIENGLNYSILLESYLCTFWLNRSLNPGWSKKYCTTKLENRDDIFVGCTCTILGSLAARIFPVAAERHITVFVFPILETNWYMFALFAMLLLLLLVVLLTYIGRMVAHQHRRVQQCRKKHVRFREDMKFDSEKAILVLIKTGGHEFAGTTSNIKLYFKSNKSSQSSYIVSQDPARPRLLRNSINKINLPAGSVQIPTRLAFGIDRNGRYPRWYCRSVSVVDLENDMEQLFIVERWIEEGYTPFIHSPYFTHSSNARPVQSWTRRFRNSFEQRFNNWFLISPMTGPWLSRNTLYTMTRFERSCVWICNVSLTILLVSLYFGPSPYEPITEESFKDDKTSLKMKEVLILGVYSAVIGISVLLFFEFAIMRCLWRRH